MVPQLWVQYLYWGYGTRIEGMVPQLGVQYMDWRYGTRVGGTIPQLGFQFQGVHYPNCGYGIRIGCMVPGGTVPELRYSTWIGVQYQD